MVNLQALLVPKLKIEELKVRDGGFSIEARKGGILAAIAAALGIGSRSIMEVNEAGLAVRRASMAGEVRAYVPHRQAASTVYVFGRPIGVLLLGAVLMVAGMIGAGVERDSTTAR